MFILEKEERDTIERGAQVQAKIIRKTDNKLYLRIWNNGNLPAYNVNFFVPRGNRLCILRSRLDYRRLEPGKAFDEYAVADERVCDEVSIITYWEDEEGNMYSKEQQGNIRKLRIG